MTERPPGGPRFSRLPGRFPPEPETQAAALTVTLAILALGGIVYMAYTAAARPAPFAIDPDETRFWGPHQISTHLSLIKHFFDARGQTLAHLAMTAAAGLVVLLGRRLGPRGLAQRLGRAAGLLVAAGGFLAPFYAPGPKTIYFLAAVPLFLLVLAVGRAGPRSLANRIVGAATLLALALAILPGFLRPPDFSRYSWYEMTYGQSHWSLAVAPGDLLAEGRKLGDEVRPQYGLALPLAWAAAERFLGPFSFGESVHLLLGLHLLYLALAAGLLRRAARGRWRIAALGLALVAPWFHFAHKSLLFPNQSAWRTIAIPLSLAALVFLAGGRPRADAFRLGLVAGAALLFNLESGIAVGAGMATFLWFRHRAWEVPRRFVALATPFAAGLLLVALAFVLLARLLLGYFVPLPTLLLSKAAFLSSGGFSGFPWTPDPWPVLMFGHAIFVLAQSALDPRPASGLRASFRACVAATLVLWFAYYANRPDPWNLSSYYLLYGLLLVDLLRFVTIGVAQRRLSLRLLGAAGLLLGIALPNLAAIAAKGADQVGSALSPALRRETPPGAGLLSDVFVEAGVAREVQARGAQMRMRRAERPVYLTADSYLVPKVAGVFSAMPVVDLCWEAMTREEYEAALGAVARAPSGRVYFDAPGTAAYDTACGLFYRQVRRDLEGTFERTGDEQGWEAWTRKR